MFERLRRTRQGQPGQQATARDIMLSGFLFQLIVGTPLLTAGLALGQHPGQAASIAILLPTTAIAVVGLFPQLLFGRAMQAERDAAQS